MVTVRTLNAGKLSLAGSWLVRGWGGCANLVDTRWGAALKHPWALADPLFPPRQELSGLRFPRNSPPSSSKPASSCLTLHLSTSSLPYFGHRITSLDLSCFQAKLSALLLLGQDRTASSKNCPILTESASCLAWLEILHNLMEGVCFIILAVDFYEAIFIGGNICSVSCSTTPERD